MAHPPFRARPDTRQRHYQDVKSRIHEQLLNRLNLERLSQVKRDEAEPELRSVIGGAARQGSRDHAAQPAGARRRSSIDVLNELFGLGPLEALLADPEVSDILVNRYNQIYIEKQRRARDRRHGLQGRPAPDAHHRAHREHGGPPHRRVEPDGRRAPARRVPRQRRSFRRWRSMGR